MRRHDFYSNSATDVGSHGGPVRCLEWLPERRLLVSAGWDAQLKLWDPRLGGGEQLSCMCLKVVVLACRCHAACAPQQTSVNLCRPPYACSDAAFAQGINDSFARKL